MSTHISSGKCRSYYPNDKCLLISAMENVLLITPMVNVSSYLLWKMLSYNPNENVSSYLLCKMPSHYTNDKCLLVSPVENVLLINLMVNFSFISPLENLLLITQRLNVCSYLL